ncbi:MAG: dienelactone hydrolase family protein [Rhodospirillaceae bacterium]|jgi:carboxymethylenebutenolidase|nr:dienelactone hydrolase family protein [Rhodospirillaceae bacterium]MBT5458185.1 dienelactone hydrolase family protein [Rhodospirillaceae bacterium]
MADINIQGADGSFGAYLATPASGSGPGLLVIQEIFGVNQVMRDLCDNFAAQGYIAVCPDLFWRIEPGVQLTDKTEDEWNKAFELMNKFLPNFEKGQADLMAAMAYVRSMEGCNGKVGCVGYCLGGSLAYSMACQSASDASVGYYPVQIDDHLPYAGHIKNPALFHVAEKDGFCPPESQAAIAEAFAKNDNIALHIYDGVDHAFAREGGGNYDKDAADLANGRTAELFKSALS